MAVKKQCHSFSCFSQLHLWLVNISLFYQCDASHVSHMTDSKEQSSYTCTNLFDGTNITEASTAKIYIIVSYYHQDSLHSFSDLKAFVHPRTRKSFSTVNSSQEKQWVCHQNMFFLQQLDLQCSSLKENSSSSWYSFHFSHLCLWYHSFRDM